MTFRRIESRSENGFSYVNASKIASGGCVADDKTFVLMSTIPVNLLIKTKTVRNAPSIPAKAFW